MIQKRVVGGTVMVPPGPRAGHLLRLDLFPLRSVSTPTTDRGLCWVCALAAGLPLSV